MAVLALSCNQRRAAIWFSCLLAEQHEKEPFAICLRSWQPACRAMASVRRRSPCRTGARRSRTSSEGCSISWHCQTQVAFLFAPVAPFLALLVLSPSFFFWFFVFIPLLLGRIRQVADSTPYAIFGHSMGALLGFEVIRALAADGLPLPLHFCPSSHAPQRVACCGLRVAGAVLLAIDVGKPKR